MKDRHDIKWKIPIYCQPVKLTFTDDVEAYAKEHNLRDVSDSDAGVFMYDYVLHIFFEWDIVSPGIVAHECKHAVNYIFGRIGQNLDVQNDEAECYLLNYLVDEVYDSFNKLTKRK